MNAQTNMLGDWEERALELEKNGKSDCAKIVRQCIRDIEWLLRPMPEETKPQ